MPRVTVTFSVNVDEEGEAVILGIDPALSYEYVPELAEMLDESSEVTITVSD
jgi:hypothetical protein